jgi:hypothetical protein
MTLNLNNPTEFAYDDECRSTAASRWAVWIQDFDWYLVGMGIADDGRKKAILLHAAGRAVRAIYGTVAEAADTYDEAKAKLTAHFEPQRNSAFERYLFGQVMQRATESVDDFAVRLRLAAAHCDFGQRVAEEIVRQLIEGCASMKLREYILKNTEADQAAK